MKKNVKKRPELTFSKGENILWSYKLKVSLFHPNSYLKTDYRYIFFLVIGALIPAIILSLLAGFENFHHILFTMFVIVAPLIIALLVDIIEQVFPRKNKEYYITNKRVIVKDNDDIKQIYVSEVKEVSFNKTSRNNSGDLVFDYKVRAKLIMEDLPDITTQYATIRLIIDSLKGTK